MNPRPLSRALLAVIVAAYAAISTLYASLTPTWQVPDEPAHYNYVRALAEGSGFPIIEPGDYDQDYLERLKAERFPPELSVATIEYEDHQPPFYYLLAAPVYLLCGGAVLPLRLLSVLLGAGLLVVAFAAASAVFPARPELPLTVAAFIAFIPQHVAMAAGVNNDVLGELVVGAALWALVVYVRAGPFDNGPSVRLRAGHGRPWPVGLLLGTALLTKTTAYIVAGVALLAIVVRWRQERRAWQWAAAQLAWMFIPALLLSAPWFIRNGRIYGWHDPLGWARHDQVATGQLRSSTYLADHGWTMLLSQMARTTFQSFWGQFGWMGVVLPNCIYRVLALLSALLLAGFLYWLFDRRRPRLTTFQRASLLLFLASCLLTILSFLWYNFKFVQHQGRYLFPALIPVGTVAALGLSTLARILPPRLRPWAIVVFFAGLATLDVYCLFRFIIPALTR